MKKFIIKIFCAYVCMLLIFYFIISAAYSIFEEKLLGFLILPLFTLIPLYVLYILFVDKN